MTRFLKPSLLCTLVLGLFCAGRVAAANPALEDIQARLNPGDAISGHFEQRKHLPELPFPLLSTGTFSFSEPAGLRWLTQTPIASELLIDRQKMVQIQDGQEVMTLSMNENPALAAVSQILFAVLSQDWKTLSQHFAIQAKLDEKQWTLQLSPKQAALSSFVKSIALEGNENLSEISLQEKTGDRTDITFSQVKNY